MTRREQCILLAAAVVVAGGFGAVKLKGSASMSEYGSKAHGAGKIVNSALRRGLANSTPRTTAADAALAYGTWTAPHWQIDTPLRPNHPLYRRPGYIGENRHCVMQGGWDQWFYNPPSEVYF
jgi:hypothetical protein